MLECKTYRFHGHNLGDPQQYRTREEIAEWSESNDPIKRFSTYLRDTGVMTDAQDETIQKEVADAIEAAVQFAESSPYPTPDELYKDVYSYNIA